MTKELRPPESTSPLPSLSAFTWTRPDRIRVSTAEETADVAEEVEDGPVELPPSAISPFSSTNSKFATSDDLTPLQLATSVMLTGTITITITIFLFRSIRRRAKRSKEMTFRSSGVKKSLKDEAVEKLKAMGSAPIEEGGGKSTTPSAAQAFLGAVSAGVIAVILYKFTTTIEAGLNLQTISDNFSVLFLLFSLGSFSLLVSKFMFMSVFALVVGV
uniref:Transmembrane protein n=1 Tax=Brassica oleracea var. oleracea TaxID=109376 RepID=A0A0D3B7N7_BRAOL